MDICLTCGKEYNELDDPRHEENCVEKLVASLKVQYKPNPDLMKILEEKLHR